MYIAFDQRCFLICPSFPGAFRKKAVPDDEKRKSLYPLFTQVLDIFSGLHYTQEYIYIHTNTETNITSVGKGTQGKY